MGVLGWLFVAFFVVAGTRHRISWDDGKIIQRAVAGNITTIQTDEITKIVQETSDVHTTLTFSRPFRRIAIYGKDSLRMKYIDVSLKHFAEAGIRRLMTAIHDRRPDLKIPTRWS